MSSKDRRVVYRSVGYCGFFDFFGFCEFSVVQYVRVWSRGWMSGNVPGRKETESKGVTIVGTLMTSTNTRYKKKTWSMSRRHSGGQRIDALHT